MARQPNAADTRRLLVELGALRLLVQGLVATIDGENAGYAAALGAAVGNFSRQSGLLFDGSPSVSFAEAGERARDLIDEATASRVN